MRIAQCIYGETAKEIEILTPAMIVKIAAAAPHKHQRRTPVRVHQVSSGEPDGLFSRNAALGGFWFATFQRPTPAAAG
jgi:hypothetical protein